MYIATTVLRNSKLVKVNLFGRSEHQVVIRIGQKKIYMVQITGSDEFDDVWREECTIFLTFWLMVVLKCYCRITRGRGVSFATKTKRLYLVDFVWVLLSYFSWYFLIFFENIFFYCCFYRINDVGNSYYL